MINVNMPDGNISENSSEEKTIKLDKNPTAQEEAVDFSTPYLNQIKKQEQDHQIQLIKLSQGCVGWIFGGGKEKAGNVAALVVLISLVFVGFTFYKFSSTESEKVLDSYFKAMSVIVSLLTLALGYLFGRRGDS